MRRLNSGFRRLNSEFTPLNSSFTRLSSELRVMKEEFTLRRDGFTLRSDRFRVVKEKIAKRSEESPIRFPAPPARSRRIHGRNLARSTMHCRDTGRNTVLWFLEAGLRRPAQTFSARGTPLVDKRGRNPFRERTAQRLHTHGESGEGGVMRFTGRPSLSIGGRGVRGEGYPIGSRS